MPSIKIHPYSEKSLLIQLADAGPQDALAALQHLEAYLHTNVGDSLYDLIPAYDSLLIRVQQITQVPGVKALAEKWAENYIPEHLVPEGRLHLVPVCYDRRLQNDLDAVSAFLELPPDTIVGLHTSEIYTVFMVGFLPGFPYLGYLPAGLAMPRKATPVPTRAGAVGIAGRQTGIYPLNIPGGWHILGYTPLQLFNPHRRPPALFAAGDRIQFQPVDYPTFKSLLSHEHAHH